MKKIFIVTILAIFLFLSFISASSVGLIEDSTWQNNLTAVRFSATAFGDIDNDGDLDLAMIGCLPGGGQNRCITGTIAKIYINNGSTLTENSVWQSNLTAVGWGALAWGDVDNDGDLDLALTGCTNASDNAVQCNGDIISKIYINNGTSLVESQTWQQNLSNVFDPSIALGDVDNDGDLDLIINGRPTSLTTKVYLNNGTSFVENSTWQNELAAIFEGQIALGDVDNDGDLDLALIGDNGGAFVSFYINNGTAFAESTQWKKNLTSRDLGSVLFGDYDNDGDLDLMTCGLLSGDHCDLYNNNGSSLLLNQSEDGSGCLPGLFRASIAFGDYDNDGDLDFADIGNEAGRAGVCENNETNNYDFLDDALAHTNISDDLKQGALAWSDVDNDGDLDLLIAAIDAGLGTTIAKVFINNNTVSNTVPSAPSSSFSSSYSNNQLNLSWGNGSDSETPTNGLYYNLMVGNSTQNHTIVSGVYGGSSGGGGGSGGGASGYFGNMMQRKAINLSVSLSNGTYYWYVQTIDTGLAKSSWSVAQNFTIGNDTTKPTLTSISSSVGSTTATITWTTDESSNSTVYYGTTIATTSSSSSSSLVTSHSIGLSSLSASTLYYYNVSSCDSSNNCNTSTQNNFTTSAASSSSGGGGGGGGSGGGGTITFWSQTYIVSDDEFEKGVVKELSKKQRVKISVNGEDHYIGVVNLTNTTATINITSDPIQIVLSIGDDAKLDVLHDDFYDIYVRLNDIVNQKANLTIQSIHEEIPEGEGSVETSGNVTGEGEEEIEEEEEKEKERLWLWFVVLLIIVILIVFLSKYFLERHRNRFNHKIKIVEKKMGNKIILIKRKPLKKRLANKMKRGVIRWLM